MKLVRYLANLGYGTRREVAGILADHRVTRRDGSVLLQGDTFVHDDVLIDGEPLDPAPGVLVMLNKPVGYVCSTREKSRLVYELLPARFAKRSPVLAAAGRLDRDTSGMLLLTDDGPLNHRITSPKAHLPREYEVRLARDLRGEEAAVFASGALTLDADSVALKPAILDISGARTARITLTEGRYHQVRRMFAAVGNHVEELSRVAIGGLEMRGLAAGEWRVVDVRERIQLMGS